MVLHPAPSTDNASCTTTPWQKNFFCTLPPQFIMPPAPLPPGCKKTILSHFIQFQHYGEKDPLAYREMKLLLSGCSGTGGTIN